MKKSMLMVLTLVLSLTLAACGQGGNAKTNTSGAEGGNGGATSEAAANNGGNKATSDLSGSVLSVGSSALQPLVDQVSKKFMEQNPNVSIQVQGGGSGTGLTQVSGGQADIGNSDVFAEEKLEAAQASELVDHQVAVVAMAAVVNPDVTVDNLTKDQLVQIFTGKVTNWKDLGGPDQKIQIVNRPSSSGTRATFEKYALGTKTEDLQGSIQEDSSGTVKKLVGETPGAIGYLALSYLDETVKAVKYEGVEATVDNVANGTYPVWAYEHMYTKGEPNEVVKAFLDYMVSPEVQGDNGDVVELGYIPISKMQVKRDVDGNITK
ncbi:MAG: phosphate ABC transporter substrate-binding protein [Paenibacillus macerans]|uniref:Phosphate-binding protein n=1 Tax=Paenibacillus macerans TaxID=44252 RepID=A0A090YHR5_PAEMA|nr:phosphate ABC transporter substrate-binding protein [Paenibacillus macerans]KFM98358.1 phosphate binding family protein [Paenibacillus macerans]MBS5914132.1 phosphate ABC transporter substrate-binding protein [Paenibacillus macerans]MCY7562261.1 phosphate ABC transporter substrate-binding protein [Paenibacillus macerans]MDU7477701.1 phosphate ABC transporter substrate-binding protein [Paenibacillus macerans]MEC0135485.1 phosphate ABC transporter substrate-binding protein [Paenibacillus mace